MKAQIAELTQQVNWLMEQMRLAKQKRFGSSSELSRYDGVNEQIRFFNEAEATAGEKVLEPDISEVKQYFRKKHRPIEEKLPADIPLQIVEHKLADDVICPRCGGPLHALGKETVREELRIIPAKAILVRHVRYIYSRRNCEKNDITVPVIKCPVTKPVISGSFASPEAVAHIMTQKFVMGSPLYRQEKELERMGIPLSRQTMSNWLLKATEDWLKPLYNELHIRLCRQTVLHADETTLQVLHEDGKPAQSKSYCGCTEPAEIRRSPLFCMSISRIAKPAARLCF